MSLSWKAVRRGAVFCAPACGARCTWAAHQGAKKGVAALCKRLGKGWKPRVWENLGWHYSAIDSSGYWKVYPRIYRGKIEGYTAFFGTKDEAGGLWAEHGKTPESAIKNLQEKVREKVREMSRLEVLLEGVEFGRSRSARR